MTTVEELESHPALLRLVSDLIVAHCGVWVNYSIEKGQPPMLIPRSHDPEPGA